MGQWGMAGGVQLHRMVLGGAEESQVGKNQRRVGGYHQEGRSRGEAPGRAWEGERKQ